MGSRAAPPQAFAGVAVGIVVLPVTYPLIPGNVANARSYGFPVLFASVDGVTPAEIMRGDAAAAAPIVEAARRLEANGVAGIVGACGSFANYQREVAAAVSIPVYMSVMVQVPFLLAGLGPNRKLAVMMASKASLTRRVLQQCGIDDPGRLVVDEVCGGTEFKRLLAGERFHVARMRDEVTDSACRLMSSDPSIAAVLLQCSDLAPYAPAIRTATGVPIYSAVELIAWLAAGTS